MNSLLDRLFSLDCFGLSELRTKVCSSVGLAMTNIPRDWDFLVPRRVFVIARLTIVTSQVSRVDNVSRSNLKAKNCIHGK